jgi:integrase
VPLPADLLPHLPAKIIGPLFACKSVTNSASKRLMAFLRDDCGITDPLKVVHSLRHRAKDQLRAAGCPLDVQYELLGHETATIAAGYGRGSPVPLLKSWIDRIGF